jgi:hypothetical protein
VALTLTSICIAGCSGSEPARPDSGVDNPTIAVSPSAGPETSASVRVRASIAVPRSPAVEALVSFVQAHAESVNAGRVTPALVSVSTPAELTRQRRVVAFAIAQGYAVPGSPVVHVVSVLAKSPAVTRLGVCFWLPSTEYVDARTGDAVNGPVPRQWAPAVATLRLAGVTWSVDTVREPDNETTIGCGSNP